MTRLTIKDFALLRDAELTLSTGFTAVTGETGSGKSLLVGAIAFLVGGKPNIGIVRDGARKAVVEGVFLTEKEGQSTLRRELMADGRTVTFHNNRRIPLRELADIVAPLVDITAQRSFSHLLDPARHLEFLDSFSKLIPERERLRQYQSEYNSLDRR
ncbi:MAG: AAA family ATPase, partial [Candidatus Electryoneaceae bacterium]|nr:AAA family ATPase [Candidatus Electryoneaceae bacterium]